ncbi:hypothetical protein C900_01720 [Fulvivirga imtechensis AK7]|uniref:Uncharacterized protein n=1 Tax=Fulvivirga imtechensis AK7 TaxID=1237149 RepID=L8JT65_9BACT|nr:pinensin family lanthipeptide [Fulvivirga imtechensis]ELR72166.1 hypothetical protein C900_01720 [Fulvivirga imtechensis AK7]
MSRRKLNIETLKVESFVTSVSQACAKTVVGGRSIMPIGIMSDEAHCSETNPVDCDEATGLGSGCEFHIV